MIPSPKSKIPRDFNNFLLNSENKTNLIIMIFQVLQSNRVKVLNVLKTNELILSRDGECFQITLFGVNPVNHLISNQEEADTKVVLHAFSVLNVPIEKYVVIRSHSGDIDINIIAITLLISYSTNVYIEYGTGSSRMDISLCDLNLNNSEREAILTLHAFSGNDYISRFFHKSKIHCWISMKISIEFEDV